MEKKNQGTKLFVTFATSLFLCLEAHAASTKDLQVQGSPAVTETDADTIRRIPDAVVELFRQKGGNILFVSSPLEHRYGSFDYKVYGLYYQPAHRIYIRNGAAFGDTLAHELGHFLYCETYPSWPAEAREILRIYGGEDPNEFFAQAYSAYCVFGTSGLSEVDAAITAANMTAEKLSRQ